MFKNLLLRILVEKLFFFLCARVPVAVGLEGVQPGFLQLFLTQTWVKCTLLDSSRCAVYSVIIFKMIRAASKKLEQDK